MSARGDGLQTVGCVYARAFCMRGRALWSEGVWAGRQEGEGTGEGDDGPRERGAQQPGARAGLKTPADARSRPRSVPPSCRRPASQPERMDGRRRLTKGGRSLPTSARRGLRELSSLLLAAGRIRSVRGSGRHRRTGSQGPPAGRVSIEERVAHRRRRRRRAQTVADRPDRGWEP